MDEDNLFYCCDLAKAGLMSLTDLFVECYYEELKESLVHYIHEECKGCWREKMLKLKSKYIHTCKKYTGNLISIYNKFGSLCIYKLSKNEAAHWMICSKFGDARRDLLAASY